MEKPILFNTEMVKAIMEDRKTQTRRVIKKKYSNTDIGHVGEGLEILYPDIIFEIQNDVPETVVNEDGSRKVHLRAYEEIKKPYEVGDILWVRETWCNLELLDDNENFIEGTEKYYYRAGEWPECDRYLKPDGSYSDNIPWRPSIHMPKDAARIFLKVIGIRAEKLHALDYDSVLREGLRTGYDGWTLAFKNLWDSTLRKDQLSMYGWDSNPWVWVIEFEKCQ